MGFEQQRKAAAQVAEDDSGGVLGVCPFPSQFAFPTVCFSQPTCEPARAKTTRVAIVNHEGRPYFGAITVHSCAFLHLNVGYACRARRNSLRKCNPNHARRRIPLSESPCGQMGTGSTGGCSPDPGTGEQRRREE